MNDFMKKYPNEYAQTVIQQFVNYAGEDVAKNLAYDFDPDKNNTLDGKVEFTYNGKTIKAGLPISVKNVADLLGIQKKAPEPAEQAEETSSNQPAQSNTPAQQPPTAPTDTIPPMTEPADSTNTAPTNPNTPAQSNTPAQPNQPASPTQLPEGATEVAGKDAYGDDCHIIKDKDGRELKRIYNKGQENEYSVTVEYDNNGKKTKEIETHCGNTKTDIIRYYKPNGKLEKVEDYIEDGKTICSTENYKYNEDGSYTKIYKNGDGKTSSITQYDKKDKTLKATYYKDDSTTIDYTQEYKYNEDGSYTKTEKHGDGKTFTIHQHDKNGRIIKLTEYKGDGKTIDNTIEYNYNEDGSYTKIYKNGDGKTSSITQYDKNYKLLK